MTSRRAAWLLCLLFLIVVVFAIGVKAADGAYRPAWLPRLYWAVGMCETHLNWRHNSGSYEGAFGFSRLAWQQYRYRGMPRHAYWATPWQQYLVIRRIGLGGNGCFIHGGYRVWMGRS